MTAQTTALTTAPTTALRVRDLTVTLPTAAGGLRAAEGVTFDLAAGHAVGLVGGSGAGKTTVLRALLGLLPRGATVAGSVRLHGRELVGLFERELAPLRGRHLGMVFQDPSTALDPVRRAGSQVAEGPRILLGRSRAQARERTLELLRLMEVADPERVARRYPHQLSGGIRQRVMIAAALACEPVVLLCDEPTSALDVMTRRQALVLLRAAANQVGTALVLVSHDLAVVDRLCDTVLVMRAGRVVEHGSAGEVLAGRRHPYTRPLARSLPGDRAWPAPGQPRRAPPSPRPTVLEVRGLRMEFRPRRPVLDGVDLHLHRAEILGLVGQSGCGKTTLGRCVVGLHRPTGGQILVAGERTTANRRRIQMVFQDPAAALNPARRVGGMLAELLRVHGLASRRDVRPRCVELLRSVGLDESVLGALPRALSGGQQQRVSLARALALEPEVIVADEVISALDVAARAAVLQLLADLRERLGVAILFISHDLAAVWRLCDRVAVLHGGRIVEDAPAGEVFDSPRHPHTRRLLEAVPTS